MGRIMRIKRRVVFSAQDSLFEPGTLLNSTAAVLWSVCLCLLIGRLTSFAPGAATTQPDSQTPLIDIQRQLDELKQGQQSILKELEEIKKSLATKPVRSDSLVRPQVPPVVSLNIHGEPFRGDAGANIGMMEYSDFDCSFCAKYASEIFPQIDHEYIQSSKIRYYFRDLPRPGDTNALLKARLARCAGEQGKFWEMHDLLFKAPSSPVEQNLDAQGQALGLDLEKLRDCLASGKYEENVLKSTASAARLGIVGTPAFLLGTLSEDGDFLVATNVLVGAESFSSLKSILDHLLEVHSKQ
jgi:protein-disulfide isomerase